MWGGCWCIGFHPEGFGDPPSAQRNRDLKRAHVERGSVHQMLVLDQAGACVGWCQYGRPAELPNIKNRATYDRSLRSLPDWRIGCIFTGSRHRRRGVARAAVLAVLEAIKAGGGGTVEAYPEQTSDRKSQRGAYLHTGPEELFAELGFVRDRQIAKWRWVMRRTI